MLVMAGCKDRAYLKLSLDLMGFSGCFLPITVYFGKTESLILALAAWANYLSLG